MPRNIANMTPEKWDFFRDLFQTPQNIRWVDYDQNKILDTKTELVTLGRFFECGCSGPCDTPVEPLVRENILAKFETLQAQGLFDDRYSQAYQRIKTKHCGTAKCTRDDIKESLRLLAMKPNIRVVEAVEKILKNYRPDSLQLKTLTIYWIASQYIALGMSKRAKEWTLQLNALSHGQHPSLAKLIPGVLKLYYQEGKLNAALALALAQELPPHFVGTSLYILMLEKDCGAKEGMTPWIAAFGQTLNEDPDVRAARGFLAGFCHDDLHEGLSEYNAAIDYSKETGAKIDYLIMQATLYARAEKFEEALKKIERIKQFSTAPAALLKYHEARGRVYHAREDYFKAVGEYAACHQLEKGNMEYLLMIGDIFMQAEAYAKAKEAFEKVLLQNPAALIMNRAEQGLLGAYKGLEVLQWSR